MNVGGMGVDPFAACQKLIISGAAIFDEVVALHQNSSSGFSRRFDHFGIGDIQTEAGVVNNPKVGLDREELLHGDGALFLIIEFRDEEALTVLVMTGPG